MIGHEDGEDVLASERSAAVTSVAKPDGPAASSTPDAIVSASATSRPR